ncbi:MAG: CDP-diacylglycerol--glycerol-3-phosphate 3-phosphatidyltransferase [Oscillospiraceae bacterium]|jgi:CDP-diacylglycerol--glycerol-3-phosphate 3-phosphatidyltransferase|nr:CDP-diacylglycerol--glycerol-3-phosphate 3-phosphatidyltransferase [Oscillospiraceae bacterium]
MKIKRNKRHTKSKIPNILTISRVVLTPVFIFFLFSVDITEEIRYWLSLIIFTLAGFTDFLDGFIARKINPITQTNSITKFGICFDPIADKILLMSAFFSLAYLNIISIYVVIFLVGRDILITGIRVFIAQKDEGIKPVKSGKIKTFLEFILGIVCLFSLICNVQSYVIEIIVWLTVIFAVWSAIVIIIKNKKSFCKGFLEDK